MRTLGLAVVVLALCVPAVEARPRLSRADAQAAIGRQLTVDKRHGKIDHYRVGDCKRYSRVRLHCAAWMAGPSDPGNYAEGWMVFSVQKRGRITVRFYDWLWS